MDKNEYLKALIKIYSDGLRWYWRELSQSNWKEHQRKIHELVEMLSRMTNELNFEFDEDGCEVHYFDDKPFITMRLSKTVEYKINHFGESDYLTDYHTYCWSLIDNEQRMCLEDSTQLESKAKECKLFNWLEFIEKGQ